MYFVYILLSEKDNKFYTGITNNIDRRLREHNRGTKSTRSTLGRGPFKLIFAQECKSRENARELEKYFKSGSGREVREELVH